MAEVRHIIKDPIVFSAVEATGGYGGLEDGYDVIFIEGQEAVWFEKTVFEATFGHVDEAEGLTSMSALALLKIGKEVERVAFAGLKKLIEFKNPDRFNYLNDDDEVVQVRDPRGIGYANGNQLPVTRFIHIDCHEAIANAPRRKVWEATARDFMASDWKVV